MTKLEADYRALDGSNPLRRLDNDSASNFFFTGEPDDATAVPMFYRRSFVEDICVGGKTFDECLATLDRLLVRFRECRISISFTESIFVQPLVNIVSHKVTAQSVVTDPTKLMKSLSGHFQGQKEYESVPWRD